MNTKVALIITVAGIIFLIGVISALTVRLVKISKVLKEHGEKFFGKNQENESLK